MRRGAYDKQLCSLPPSAPFNERFPHLVGRKEQRGISSSDQRFINGGEGGIRGSMARN